MNESKSILLRNIANVFPCFLGFCSVALGAFGAHALKDRFGSYENDLWKTATMYLMVHSVAAFVSLRESKVPYSTQLKNASASFWFSTASSLFCIGGSLFSFSLFLLAFTGVRGLGAITPFGGVCLLLGWIALGMGCLKSSKY